MDDFSDIITAQTDKPRLVRFAVDCAKRVVAADDKKGCAALAVAENWLLNPSEENRLSIDRIALVAGMEDGAATVACSLAAFAASDTDVRETAEYTTYIIYDTRIASGNPSVEYMWQIERFKELFPETKNLF